MPSNQRKSHCSEPDFGARAGGFSYARKRIGSSFVAMLWNLPQLRALSSERALLGGTLSSSYAGKPRTRRSTQARYESSGCVRPRGGQPTLWRVI
jgi:hypothetical protein